MPRLQDRMTQVTLLGAKTLMPRLHWLGEPMPTDYEAKVFDVDGA